MDLSLDNIWSKLQRNADVLGMAAGVFSVGYEDLINNVQTVLEHGHMPDLQQMIREAFRGHMGDNMKTGILAWIGGYIAEEMGYDIGKTLKKGSEGYMKGLLIQHVIYWSGHTPKGEPRQYLNESSSGSVVRGL